MVRHPNASFSIWTVDLLLCLPSSFACELLKTSTDWFQNTLVSKSVHVGRKLNSPEIIKENPCQTRFGLHHVSRQGPHTIFKVRIFYYLILSQRGLRLKFLTFQKKSNTSAKKNITFI